MPAELHPFVLHFAVGLLLAAPLFDASGLLFRRETLLHAGRWTTLMGTVAALLSVATGLAAQATMGARSAAGAPLLHLHEALGYVLIALWVPVAAWRAVAKGSIPVRLRTIYLSLSFAGGAVVAAETLLGSVIVYRHGMGLTASARIDPAAAPQPATNGRVKVVK